MKNPTDRRRGARSHSGVGTLPVTTGQRGRPVVRLLAIAGAMCAASASAGTSTDTLAGTSANASAIASADAAAPTTSAGSQGCGAAAPKSGVYTITHGGITRTYGISVPPGYDRNHPARLVLVFHGWGGNETEFLGDPAVIAESNRRGYVLVAPRGIGSGDPDRANNSWTFRGSTTGLVADGTAILPVCDASITPDYSYASCRSGTARNTCSWTQCQDDDVDFVAALLERVEADLCIDTQQVYAAGGSNGGMFTWELGRDPRTAPLLRGIAPIIGLPHRGDLRPPGRPGGMPVLLITGLKDPVVPPGKWDDPSPTTTSNDSDRFYYTGATAIVRVWSQAEGCPVGPAEKPFDTGVPGAECRTYCAAANGAWPRVLDCRAPMGHDYQTGWSWRLVLDFFDRL